MTSAPAHVQPQARAGCFLGVPGARLVVEELPDGLELSYSAEVGEAAAVRSAVRDLAARQNRARAVEGGPGDVELRPGDSISPPVTMLLAPAAHAEVTDMPLGARLTLAPMTAEARALIRDELRARPTGGPSDTCPADVRLSPRVRASRADP